jgi:23S rRNA (guanosine2251-2'-O)-methyltransferase
VLRDARGIEDILHAAGGVPVERVERRVLDALVPGGLHQGVVLEADPLPVLDLHDWLAMNPPDGTVLMALDEIEDPHNYGAIVRSAAACGAGGVMTVCRRAAPLSPAAVKSAAGAFEHIPIVQVTNMTRALGQCKERGFWVAGLDADGPQDLWDADLSGKTVIVVGNEGRGLRRLVREHCDFLLRIPLSGPITSLNASVSAAIALAECLRQRRRK